MAVAQFHTQFRDLIERLGGTPEFHGPPNEIPDAIRTPGWPALKYTLT
jgi:hypothetical protein